MLRIEALTKSYGSRPALDGVDLEVAPGEIVGLLGPNGAGKTTLVSIVAGLRQADGGRVLVDGREVREAPRAARCAVGFAPQDLGVYPTATVRENLRFGGRLAGLRRPDADRSLAAVAERMGLASLLDDRVQVLSGGQKRRLHAAIALVHRPLLALLDEPTVGADVETRRMLLDVVVDLAREGTAVVYTTHYLHELEALRASLAVIESGRLVARGSQEQLIAQHAVSAVEVTVDGPPPAELLMTWPTAAPISEDATSSTWRITADDPVRTAADLLNVMHAGDTEPRSIDIVYPGLEAAYLALTGRRTAEDDVEEETVDALV